MNPAPGWPQSWALTLFATIMAPIWPRLERGVLFSAS